MRPVRLTLRGFTSFKEETSIDLASLDLFVICGPTGAGKSSILDAMTFALFADAPRVGTAGLGNLIALGSKRFQVVLDFLIGTHRYRVTRVRRRTGAGSDQLERLVGGDQYELVQTGAGPVTAEIERLLGLNYDHFTQAVFLPQGKFAEFLKGKPADRRRLLNELLRLLVFERMQERAREEQDQFARQKEQTARRLREDFEGVSEEAHGELARSYAEVKEAAEAANQRLPILEQRRDELRRGRERTVELEEKQQDLAKWQDRQLEIKAARQEASAASRAAACVPLLNEADKGQQEQVRRRQELTLAEQGYDKARAAHVEAKAELDRAAEEAAPLPALREHLQALAVALGKISLRDQLARQLKDHQLRQQKLEKERDGRAEEANALADTIAKLVGEHETATAELAAISYNEKRHLTLDGAREPAVRLQGTRRRIAESLEQADKDAVAAITAETEAARAEAAGAQAEQAKHEAIQRRDNADGALRACQDAHQAAHLRSGLDVGAACPVCRRAITALPAEELVPELTERQGSLTAATKELTRKEKAALQLTTAAAVARATAEAARAKAGSGRADAESQQSAFGLKEQTLEESLAGLLTGVVGKHVEDRALEALRQASAQGKHHLQAAGRVNYLQNALALRGQEKQTCDAEVMRLGEDIQGAAEAITRGELSLDRVRQEIRTAAGTEEPEMERIRVQGEIDRMGAQLDRARHAESETRNRQDLAQARAEACGREAEESIRRATEASARAVEALVQGGFAEPNTARAAARTPDQLKRLTERVTEYDNQILTLTARLATLEGELRGQRISPEVFQQAENEHAICLKDKQESSEQAALLSQRLEQMGKRLQVAAQLRQELVMQEQQHRVYHHLTHDLRSDKFQSFLLEETLAALVEEASRELARLTSDRYGLNFDDGRIAVVDNDNACELRAIDSFSGGETFLASLALALALSGQVQRAVGAVHLDCLFIDEGFGTLDPETLRTVSDAIRGLQIGGRMVGIITHVPELKEEFDQRLIVDKEGGSSRVQIEVA